MVRRPNSAETGSVATAIARTTSPPIGNHAPAKLNRETREPPSNRVGERAHPVTPNESLGVGHVTGPAVRRSTGKQSPLHHWVSGCTDRVEGGLFGRERGGFGLGTGL
jgi:hypothetical protein